MPLSNSHSPAIMLLISAKDWCVAQGEVTVSHFLELKVNSLQTISDHALCVAPFMAVNDQAFPCKWVYLINST